MLDFQGLEASNGHLALQAPQLFLRSGLGTASNRPAPVVSPTTAVAKPPPSSLSPARSSPLRHVQAPGTDSVRGLDLAAADIPLAADNTVAANLCTASPAQVPQVRATPACFCSPPLKLLLLLPTLRTRVAHGLPSSAWLDPAADQC